MQLQSAGAGELRVSCWCVVEAAGSVSEATVGMWRVCGGATEAGRGVGRGEKGGGVSARDICVPAYA